MLYSSVTRREPLAILSRIPALSNAELLNLFKNAATKIDTQWHDQSYAVLDALEFEWERRWHFSANGGRQYGIPNEGMLSVLGYHVGNTFSLSARDRRKILLCIFERKLPFLHSTRYMDEWGYPFSRKRLAKIGNCLSSFIRSAKNSPVMAQVRAIREWAADLEWFDTTIGQSETIKRQQ